MRKLLAAALLVSPVLCAQTGKAPANSTLQARFEAPALASDSTTRTTLARPVSSGITAPVLLNEATLDCNVSEIPGFPTTGSKVQVNYIVDEKGVPHNIHIAESKNALVEARVVDAVSRLRYTPGKLNGQNVSVPVNLEVVLQR